MGGVIVVFILAGLMMIPAVRGAIFGSKGEVDAPALAVAGKPITDKPRSDAPMGEYTPYFGKVKTFVIDENMYSARNPITSSSRRRSNRASNIRW